MNTTKNTTTTPDATAEKSAYLARVKRTFRAPRDYGNAYAFTITVEARQIGEQDPYFAVTGDIYHKSTRTRTCGGTRACGCLHDEAAQTWKAILPIIRLHLCSSITGEPSSAEANGYYWLAGAAGGLGEQYHGGSGSDGKSQAECLRILSEHLRISLDDAVKITNTVSDAYSKFITEYQDPPIEATLNPLNPWERDKLKGATITAKNVFHDFVQSQRARWEKEAQNGLALIRKLSESEVAA